ncbi:ParB/RepB/Spo0J family partition protein [Symbiopectobacterium purcellii]|uniref:ParB/RepB/Spo0J family partition protein n=1 Tax=Symbiopectobacterium purcellii TaxID=2871826 RepID=UPI003F86DB42
MAKNSKDVYGASGKTNVLTFEPESLHMIDDPAHPLYDERIYLPIDEAMVLNIMDQGVLEPIIVWKDPESGKVCIVDGRQRVRHTIEANRRLLEKGEKPLLVPGVVRRGSASRVSKAMVSANEIRRPDTPLGRAKKMASAMERGDDEEDLALTFGCSVQTVRTTLALLDCTQAVQTAVEAGHVNVTQARQLAAMEPEQQREKVKELVQATRGVSGHERVRRQRKVLGNAKPKLKSRKEITKALDAATGDYAAALRWVLGAESPAEGE